jgi:tRNA pseudouridine32 synthase/23S rRNA pseudouridine746 synthase
MPQFSAEALLARVLYRDEAVIVVDKPAGLPVHRTPRGQENLEEYFEALRFDAARAPSLAHRLDKDTSGCLLLGRHRESLARLGKWFEQGKIGKTYLAITLGVPEAPVGEMREPILRRDLGRGKWEFACDPAGQEARTSYRIVAQKEGLALVALTPHTGRTHQLRLHCAAIGCPILGDPYYGGKLAEEPLHLHSAEIVIPPMVKDAPVVRVKAPVPVYFEQHFSSELLCAAI